MNKIVREHYPVEKLPEDLRVLFSDTASVTIEVVAEGDHPTSGLSSKDAVALMRQMQEENSRKGRGITEQEAVDRIRTLRDEWDA